MAYSTGARLKSSAVELYRGLESSLQNREQFELALAKVFGSCTGDFQDLQGIPQGHSSLSLEEDSPRNTLGAAPLRRENSNTSSRRNKSGSKASSGKQRKRQGCEGSGSQSSTTPGRPEARERRQSRADYGEHIYAQLFMDDQNGRHKQSLLCERRLWHGHHRQAPRLLRLVQSFQSPLHRGTKARLRHWPRTISTFPKH